MNTEIHRKILSLSANEYNDLLARYQNAPVMQAYITAIRNMPDKTITVREIVLKVYGKEAKQHYAKCENRFYKLRKNLLQELNRVYNYSNNAENGWMTDEEKQKNHCRNLIESGHFGEAEQHLLQLKKTCETNNMFELLPEIIDLLIQCKQTLNKLNETEVLYKDFIEALEMHKHIYEAKIYVKKIYENNFINRMNDVQLDFQPLERLSRRYAEKPRFKLIYNFAAAYYKTGSGGNNETLKPNVITRHIKMVKKIMFQYPKMPAINYTGNYEYKQQYRILEMEAFYQFKTFRFAEAANNIYALLLKTLDKNSQLQRLLSEVLITNAIHMQIAALNKERALDCVRIYIQFLRDNKHSNRLPEAFCELANVAGSFGIKNTFVSHKQLFRYIDDYEKSLGNNISAEHLGSIQFLRVKLFWLSNEYVSIKKIIETATFKKYIGNIQVQQFITNLYQAALSKVHSEDTMKSMKKRLVQLRNNSNNATEISLFNWLSFALESITEKSLI